MPRVSAIVPCYQMAHCVVDAVESAIAQEDAEVEIVVVDDGSTDDPAGALAKFGPRVRLVRQENRGLPAARNAAARVATGDYFAFLDADDKWLPHKTRLQLAALDAAPRAGFVYGQANGVGDGNWRRLLGKAPEGVAQTGNVLIPLLATGNLIPVLTGMVRREAFEAIGGFDETLRKGGEDFDFWLRLAERYEAAYVAEPVAVYRLHEGGFYNTNNELWFDSVMRLLDRVERGHPDEADVQSALFTARAGVYIGRAVNRLDRGDRVGAKADLEFAVQSPRYRDWALRLQRRAALPTPVYRGLRTLRRRIEAAVAR
jgi:glycosyltransferase involved in cell wall biosynthesis